MKHGKYILFTANSSALERGAIQEPFPECQVAVHYPLAECKFCILGKVPNLDHVYKNWILKHLRI